MSSKAFDLVFAFDEVISCGVREMITLQQIRTNVTMESHDEKVHNMILKVRGGGGGGDSCVRHFRVRFSRSFLRREPNLPAFTASDEDD